MRDVNVHGDAASDIRFCFFFLFDFAFVERVGRGDGGGMLTSMAMRR